jgi:putative nucleotidyltransferase with HDIG domain
MYRIKKIENFVCGLKLPVGHGFNHANRVKNNAMLIATSLGYDKPALVEVAALLHDIGLSKDKENTHASIGAEMAKDFLSREKLFAEEEIDLIFQAINLHNKPYQDGPLLLDIIRDADIIDLLGTIGISRALITKAGLPLYDLKNPKGETWGFGARDFDKRFLNGVGIGPTIIDQLNFQVSCRDNLRIDFSKKIATPLVNELERFVLNLEKEIS